jgi:hypothetical protein
MSTTTVQVNGPATNTLHVTQRARGLLLGTCGEVFFAVWSTKPTQDLFELQRAGLAVAVRANPGRAFFLCVVSPNADPPEQAERDASSRMISQHGSDLLGTACVVEGSGFRAAITRTVLTGITLFIRTPSPVTIFDSVDAASNWMQRRRSGRDLSRLAAQLDELRLS